MVVTAQDTGEQKPSEAFYHPIIDTFGGIADEYMMVGDSWVRDLQPAQEMGLLTVLVGDSQPQGTPDYHVDRLAALEEVVQEVRER